MRILAICFLAAITLVTSAESASIECKDIDDSAVTYFPDSDTSSTTTTNKDCTVSIAGVTAQSSFPAIQQDVPNCVQTLGRNRFSGIEDPNFFSRVAVPYAASWSIPNFSQPPLTMLFDSSVGSCMNWAEGVVREGNGLATVFDLDQDELTEIGRCVSQSSDGGGGIECERREGQLLIRFFSPFGAHVVSLPRP